MDDAYGRRLAQAEAEVLELDLQPSARRGRGNRMAEMLAAERAREAQLVEGRVLRGEDDEESLEGSDVDFEDKVPDDADEIQQDIEDDLAGTDEDERAMDEDEDAAERELQREERAARRNKDSSLFYLRKKRTTTRKPLRSTFDLDEPDAPEHAAPEEEEGRARPSRAEQSNAESVSAVGDWQRGASSVGPVEGAVAGSSTGPGTIAGAFVRERPKRSAHSTYRRDNLDGSTSPVRQKRNDSPKRKKPAPVPTRLTQEERLADALDMEEENIEELKTWLANEERKRLSRRPAPKVLLGPKLTWLSTEATRKIKILADEDLVASKGRDKGRRRQEDVQEDVSESAGQRQQGVLVMREGDGSSGQPSLLPKRRSKVVDQGGKASLPDDNPSGSEVDDGLVEPHPAAAAEGTAPARQARNYLHLSHPPKTQREEHSLLFGDHVDWGQPAPTPVTPDLCVITGLPARYKDPRTGKPYATLEAYAELKRLYHVEPVGPPSPSAPTAAAAAPPSSSRLPRRRAAASPPPLRARPAPSKRKRVRIDESADEVEPVEPPPRAPPSPAKSASGRSNKSSTGDELVMDAWE